MIEALITSKTRVKLLLKFFLNSQNTGYLRSLETEFGESTNAIRQELNRFESSGLLISTFEANKKIYRANIKHPLYPVLHRLLKKDIGIDKIIKSMISKVGHLQSVYLAGKLAEGIDSNFIELWLIGEGLDEKYLKNIIKKTEKVINRKVKYLNFAEFKFNKILQEEKTPALLLLWEA